MPLAVLAASRTVETSATGRGKLVASSCKRRIAPFHESGAGIGFEGNAREIECVLVADIVGPLVRVGIDHFAEERTRTDDVSREAIMGDERIRLPDVHG